jgi:hypothetical protein
MDLVIKYKNIAFKFRDDFVRYAVQLKSNNIKCSGIPEHSCNYCIFKYSCFNISIKEKLVYLNEFLKSIPRDKLFEHLISGGNDEPGRG